MKNKTKKNWLAAGIFTIIAIALFMAAEMVSLILNTVVFGAFMSINNVEYFLHNIYTVSVLPLIAYAIALFGIPFFKVMREHIHIIGVLTILIALWVIGGYIYGARSGDEGYYITRISATELKFFNLEAKAFLICLIGYAIAIPAKIWWQKKS